MKPASPHSSAINGGSSSIRFAPYQVGEPFKRRLYGKVDRIGLSDTSLTTRPGISGTAASDHKSTVDFLVDWLEEQNSLRSVRALGCRVVYGMTPSVPKLVAQDLLDELHRISPYAPEHQPHEIEPIEAFRQRHPKLPQAASFDTPFHRNMPRVAKLLPIPHHYEVKGI